MTAITQALIGSSGSSGPNLSGGITLSAGTLAPTSADASFTIGTSGGMTYEDGSGPANWYTPSTASIGTSYYYRLTISTGSNPTFGGTAGTVYQGTSARQYGWTATSGVTVVATGTLSIYSDAGATQLVASCAVDVNVESSL